MKIQPMTKDRNEEKSRLKLFSKSRNGNGHKTSVGQLTSKISSTGPLPYRRLACLGYLFLIVLRMNGQVEN